MQVFELESTNDYGFTLYTCTTCEVDIGDNQYLQVHVATSYQKILHGIHNWL